MDIENWIGARAFLLVARTGSLTAAARELRTSQPTVSRHILALEEQLGATLFVRHARGMRLTDRARELLPAAEAVAAAMEDFERNAAGVREAVAGSVRIATSEIVGVEVLVPRLSEFREAYPSVQVELDLSNAPSDLSKGEADIAIRLYQPTKPDLITKLIGSVPVGFYASVEYIERRGAPPTRSALLEHELVGFDSRGYMARAFETVDERFTSGRLPLRTDSLTAHLSCARYGAGIAAIQLPIARRYPELVAVLPDEMLPSVPFWLTAHEDVRNAAHVRVVWEWLERVLRDYVS